MQRTGDAEDSIVELQRTKPDAFYEYGIGAQTMATTYDFVTYNQQLGGAKMSDGRMITPNQTARSGYGMNSQFPTLMDGYARNSMYSRGTTGAHTRGSSYADQN